MPPQEIVALCLRLTRYKKDNKELLDYLLFEADNEPAYIEKVKAEVDLLFENIPKSNAYFAKKTLRKILRITNKYIKYSGLKQTETELLNILQVAFPTGEVSESTIKTL